MAAMNELKQRVLRRKRSELCDSLDFEEELQHHAISKEIITPRVKDEILDIPGRFNKMAKFLDHLERKTNDDYDKFMQILRDMKFENLVQMLFHEWNILKEEEVKRVKLGPECDSTTSEPSTDWIDSLPERMKTAVVTDIFLTLIGMKLGAKWVPLARMLGFKQWDIDSFRDSDREQYNQATKMLIDWYRINGKEATVEKLCRVMRRVGVEESVYQDAVKEEWNELMISRDKPII